MRQIITPIMATKKNDTYFAYDGTEILVLSSRGETAKIGSCFLGKNHGDIINFCFDENKNCFWGCSAQADNLLYSMGKDLGVQTRIITDFSEYKSVSISGKNMYTEPLTGIGSDATPRGICHNFFTDTLALCYKSAVLILGKTGNYIGKFDFLHPISDISCYFSNLFILSENKIFCLKYNGKILWEITIDFPECFKCFHVKNHGYDKTQMILMGENNVYSYTIWHI